MTVFYFYRYWISKKANAQSSLFDNFENSKEQEQDVFIRKKTNEYFNNNNIFTVPFEKDAYVFCKIDVTNPNTFAFQFSKEKDENTEILNEQKAHIFNETIVTHPYIIVFINTQYQSIIIQHTKDYNKRLNVIKELFKERILKVDDIEIEAISDQEAFLDFFKKHEINSVDLIFNMPNMANFNKSIKDSLKNLEESNVTGYKNEVKSRERIIPVGLLKEMIQYITDGGGKAIAKNRENRCFKTSDTVKSIAVPGHFLDQMTNDSTPFTKQIDMEEGKTEMEIFVESLIEKSRYNE